jgi:two-component system OmpR family sensor kinase
VNSPFPRSIRGRLLLAVIGLTLLALVIAGGAVLLVFRGYLAQRTDDQLTGISQRVRATLASREELRLSEGRLAALVPEGSVVVVRDPAGAPLVSLRTVGDEATTLAAAAEPGPVTVPASGRDLRIVTIPVSNLAITLSPNSNPALPASSVIVAADLTEDQQALRNLALIELTVTAATMVVLAAAAAVALRIGLRPLVAMARTADAIAAGNTGERLPTPPPNTETGRLAAALNRSFDARDRAERGLRDFIADASHELRTPLTLVHGWADLYLQGGLTDPDAAQSAMERVGSETARMRTLVDELLLLARLDARQPLRHESVDLAEITAEIVADARVVAADHEIRLSADQPALVSGDAARLRQVARNLVGNATAHTPAGSIIDVRVHVDDRHVILTVADDGPGLSPSELDRVFERFHRSHPDRVGGNGLGLSIVDAVVRAHDGTVSAQPNPGGGTRFTVVLARLRT